MARKRIYLIQLRLHMAWWMMCLCLCKPVYVKTLKTFFKILKITVKYDYTQYDQYNIDSNKGADTS